MKIAFVGKGGSGKTTVSSLFAQYLAETQSVLAIDADINMHMAELFDVNTEYPKIMSEKVPSEAIRTYLRGTNDRIPSNEVMKKSTPPGSGSRLINAADTSDWFMRNYTDFISSNLSCAIVGTYSEDGIASSCYHNNLSILENILSHSTDQGTIVVDMVAGTDAFASTLFAQFDALFFVVEPTTRSVAVYKQYETLAASAGVSDRVCIVGNKIESDEDMVFIEQACRRSVTATLSRSAHVLAVDKGQEHLNVAALSFEDRKALENIKRTASDMAISSQDRLPRLWQLHETHVNQAFIKERFGDLTNQIDRSFHYLKAS